MLIIDTLVRAHEEGDITRGELFAHLIALLSPATMDEIRGILGREPACLAAFDVWLGDLAGGAKVYLGRHAVALTGDAAEAIRGLHASAGAHQAKASAERPAGARHQRRIILLMSAPFGSLVRERILDDASRDSTVHRDVDVFTTLHPGAAAEGDRRFA